MTERLYCALPRFLLHSHCDPPPRTLSQSSPDRSPRGAGWSSRVARRAHNPNVAGSNPAPTTSQESRFDGAQPVKNEAQLGALNGDLKCDSTARGLLVTTGVPWLVLRLRVVTAMLVRSCSFCAISEW